MHEFRDVMTAMSLLIASCTLSHLVFVHLLSCSQCFSASVIFVNGNENGEKRENNEFVN